MTFPQLRSLKEGKAAGILTGGNISLVVETIGTAYEIDTVDKILFLEDIGEDRESLGRYLMQLKRAGKLKRGIIFGRMIDCFEEGESMRRLVDKIFAKSDIPVLFGFPSGHVQSREDANVTLPLGIEVRIDSAALKVSISETAVQ